VDDRARECGFAASGDAAHHGGAEEEGGGAETEEGHACERVRTAVGRGAQESESCHLRKCTRPTVRSHRREADARSRDDAHTSVEPVPPASPRPTASRAKPASTTAHTTYSASNKAPFAARETDSSRLSTSSSDCARQKRLQVIQDALTTTTLLPSSDVEQDVTGAPVLEEHLPAFVSNTSDHAALRSLPAPPLDTTPVSARALDATTHAPSRHFTTSNHSGVYDYDGFESNLEHVPRHGDYPPFSTKGCHLECSLVSSR
jgi:hypothetical protein